MKRRVQIAVAVAGLAVGLAVPATAESPPLAMLDQLEKGRWELRMREGDGGTEKLCLGDPRRLIQLRHPAAACERIIVDDTAGEVTVQYSCRGKGYGRTHIRRESSRLVQIDTQGIADGLPFAVAIEARRVGTCPA
jgi:hypothetical protein